MTNLLQLFLKDKLCVTLDISRLCKQKNNSYYIAKNLTSSYLIILKKHVCDGLDLEEIKNKCRFLLSNIKCDNFFKFFLPHYCGFYLHMDFIFIYKQISNINTMQPLEKVKFGNKLLLNKFVNLSTSLYELGLVCLEWCASNIFVVNNEDIVFVDFDSLVRKPSILKPVLSYTFNPKHNKVELEFYVPVLSKLIDDLNIVLQEYDSQSKIVYFKNTCYMLTLFFNTEMTKDACSVNCFIPYIKNKLHHKICKKKIDNIEENLKYIKNIINTSIREEIS
jgi:hypothetical protein